MLCCSFAVNGLLVVVVTVVLVGVNVELVVFLKGDVPKVEGVAVALPKPGIDVATPNGPLNDVALAPNMAVLSLSDTADSNGVDPENGVSVAPVGPKGPPLAVANGVLVVDAEDPKDVTLDVETADPKGALFACEPPKMLVGDAATDSKVMLVDGLTEPKVGLAVLEPPKILFEDTGGLPKFNCPPNIVPAGLGAKLGAPLKTGAPPNAEALLGWPNNVAEPMGELATDVASPKMGLVICVVVVLLNRDDGEVVVPPNKEVVDCGVVVPPNKDGVDVVPLPKAEAVY